MKRKLLGAVSCAALTIGGFLGMASPAFAATSTVNLNFSGSGTAHDIISAMAVCDPCAPDIFFTGDPPFNNSWGAGGQAELTAQASWSDAAPVGLQYSQGNLRHGSTLDLSDTLNPSAGTVTVNYSVSGAVGLYGTDLGGSDESCYIVTISPTPCNDWHLTDKHVDIGPLTDSDSFGCTMPLPGDSPRTCTNTKTINLYHYDFLGLGLFTLNFNLIIDESVTVTGSGVTSLRLAAISGGQAIPDNTLNFSGSEPQTLSDPIAIGCHQPVGSDLLYSLTSNGYSASPATYDGDIKLALDTTFGNITTPPLIASSGVDLGPIAMTAPDQQVDLGPVLANVTPPTVSSGGPYSGFIGTPISLDASGTTSPCGLSDLTFQWHFSDGGSAFGVNPSHTFESPGLFSGEVTATDSDGNSAAADFSVNVADLAPVAHAGPNMSSEWGLPVTLNGSAGDPGTDQIPLLTYNWQFGDGSPSASGGTSATHIYSAPGVYTATFTACDPEGMCNSDTADVTVTTRGSTLSYTGGFSSDVTDSSTFSASLIDDQGKAEVGRTVKFFADGSATPFASATTDGSGNVSVAYPFPLGSVGAHSIVGSFAGDGFYVPSSFSFGFNVAKDGTVTTYTGPASTQPSKSLTLSATVTDDSGRAVDGLTVKFTVGSQGCSGVTAGPGTATCTIAKVTLKPGNFIVVAQNLGNGNYLGSSNSKGFNVK
jgi:hypothetical protein